MLPHGKPNNARPGRMALPQPSQRIHKTTFLLERVAHTKISLTARGSTCCLLKETSRTTALLVNDATVKSH